MRLSSEVEMLSIKVRMLETEVKDLKDKIASIQPMPQQLRSPAV